MVERGERITKSISISLPPRNSDLKYMRSHRSQCIKISLIEKEGLLVGSAEGVGERMDVLCGLDNEGLAAGRCPPHFRWRFSC